MIILSGYGDVSPGGYKPMPTTMEACNAAKMFWASPMRIGELQLTKGFCQCSNPFLKWVRQPVEFSTATGKCEPIRTIAAPKIKEIFPDASGNCPSGYVRYMGNAECPPGAICKAGGVGIARCRQAPSGYQQRPNIPIMRSAVIVKYQPTTTAPVTSPAGLIPATEKGTVISPIVLLGLGSTASAIVIYFLLRRR